VIFRISTATDVFKRSSSCHLFFALLSVKGKAASSAALPFAEKREEGSQPLTGTLSFIY
jgi:hypothetical protein